MTVRIWKILGTGSTFRFFREEMTLLWVTEQTVKTNSASLQQTGEKWVYCLNKIWKLLQGKVKGILKTVSWSKRKLIDRLFVLPRTQQLVTITEYHWLINRNLRTPFQVMISFNMEGWLCNPELCLCWMWAHCEMPTGILWFYISHLFTTQKNWAQYLTPLITSSWK